METLRNVVLVAVGGGFGSVARYLVSRFAMGAFPWGTFAVNIIGSLLIGLLTGLVAKGTLSTEMRLLLITGFCGGFTTFSTFANESFAMHKAGDVLIAALYVSASVFVGIVAVYVGLHISK